MPKFILSYRFDRDYDAFADPDGDAAWRGFLTDDVATAVVEPGWPVFERATVVGETGASTQLGGYSVIEAADLDGAVSIATRCPTMARGGGVEIGVLAELPADHPAERMRSRRAEA